MGRKSSACAIVAAVLLASPASPQVPPDIAEKTRALGQTMNPAEGYSPWDGKFDLALFDGVTITRSIAYGADPAQKLDIYLPDGLALDPEAAARPVLVFVHGGGFVGGRRAGQPYPDNIPAWAVSQGMVGVSIDYRVAPSTQWPGGAADLASAISWLREHLPEYRGDPDRIVLFGHSAGANHVADYVAHSEVQGAEMAGIKGAALLSPNYAFEPPAADAPPHVYYATRPAYQLADPVLAGLEKSQVPLFVGIAQFDPDMMRAFGLRARERLCRKAEICPAFAELADHNHFTEGYALGTVDRSLAEPLVAWMKLNGVL
jgi:triacylglycerol lipase